MARQRHIGRVLCVLLAVLLSIPVYAVETPAVNAAGAVNSSQFDDVSTADRFSAAVDYAADLGLFYGGGNRRFYPDLLITRGQTVTVLHRLALYMGITQADADALQWAIDAEILKGTSTASYDETAPVTRAQMAAFLYRFARYAGCSVDCGDAIAAYPDADAVPEYARAPLAWTIERGIFGGVVSGSLCPKLPVSRAQTALMMTALAADMTKDTLAVEITDAAALSAAGSASRDHHAQIQAYVDSVAKKYGAVGLQAAVIENGRVVDAFAYGWATKGADRMTADHKMRVASISKVVIGMDAMRMREDGLIDLDAQLGTYWGANFQNPYYRNQPVTIRGILSHTSSIIPLEIDSANNYAAVKQRQKSAAGYSRVVPGSVDSWQYNNYAFGVLGMTLELAGNKTLDALSRQYFYDALDIDAGFYAGDLGDGARLATLYGHGGGVERSTAAQRRFHAGAAGSRGLSYAGGLVSSANDLAKLTAILASGGEYEGVRMLRADSVGTMEHISERKVSDGFYQALPLRYRESLYGRAALYYHTGSGYGVYNCISYDPTSGDGVVVLSTGASGAKDKNGIYAVCGEIMNCIYGITQRTD